jgi:cytochrome b subunit of formate dehydrogenase
MGILIICIVLAIIGGFGMHYFDFNQKDIFPAWVASMFIAVASIIIAVIIAIDMFFIGVSIDQDYKYALQEKEMLEYRLTNSTTMFSGNENLCTEIFEFNKKVQEHKRWSDSFLFKGTYNKKIGTIEPIKYKYGERAGD